MLRQIHGNRLELLILCSLHGFNHSLLIIRQSICLQQVARQGAFSDLHVEKLNAPPPADLSGHI